MAAPQNSEISLIRRFVRVVVLGSVIWNPLTLIGFALAAGGRAVMIVVVLAFGLRLRLPHGVATGSPS